MNIIHIGAPKTASTLIQNVLNDEREALASIGVNVPDLGWDRGRGHYGFRVSLNRSVDGDPHYEALREDFRQIFSATQINQIISTETLWPVKPNALLRVFPELSGSQVLLFCRNQTDIILSHYFQKIKGGGEARSIEDFFEAQRENYDYCRVIACWEASFGLGNVHPILYEEACLEGGIVARFLSHCFSLLGDGQPGTDELIRRLQHSTTRSNVRISGVVAAMLLAVNRSKIAAEAKDVLKKEILAAKDTYSASTSEGLQMEPALVSRVRTYYLKSNLDLFNRFFGGKTKLDAFWT